MKEVLELLEKLEIKLLETAEPALIKDGIEEGLKFLNQRLSFRQEQLKELKAMQHMATFGHGLLKVDAQIVFVEACIDALAAAIKLLFDYKNQEMGTDAQK